MHSSGIFVRLVALLAMTCLAVWAVLAAVLPVALLVVLGVTVGRVPAALRDGLGSPAGNRLMTALVVAVVLVVVTMVIAPMQAALGSVIQTGLRYRMQARLMAAVSGPAGIAHLEDAGVLERIATAEGSLLSEAQSAAPAALLEAVSSRLCGVLACGVVASFRWWLGLLLLGFWIAARRPMARGTRMSMWRYGSQAGLMRRADYFRRLATRLAPAAELRIFGLADWAVERYRSLWSEGITEIWSVRDRHTRTTIMIGAGVLVVYGFALWVLADAAYARSVSLGRVVMLLPTLALSTQVGLTFNDISLARMLLAFPALGDLESDLSSRAVALRGSRSPDGMPEREVRFEDVGFRYPGASRPVFEHVDLTLAAGCSTAIVGANGVGKTTLVKLLARLHDPSSGRILVDGTDLSELDAPAWQRKVAAVFQDFAHYPLTVAENVGFGAVEHLGAREGIEDAIARAGARGLVEDLPAGLGTVVSRSFSGGVDLSGGQWQRIALARALYAAEHGARVLVLDEPTSWLDARGEAEFFDRFLEITAGLTTVVISHRYSTIRRADRIYVLNAGGVVEQGDHTQLMALGGHYAQAFTIQAARFGHRGGSGGADGS